ncbi:MAG: linear amide C-N hydrolase [bacterium]|nr:linear amide C-N hydrolase [bacterium]
MKFKKFTILTFSLAICFATLTTVEACSSFFLNTKNQRVFAYNLDIPINNLQSHIFINKKDQKKIAYMPWKDKPLQWTSKYGSITFNFIGKDFPFTGMNEKGLCISETSLYDTEYPAKNSKPVIGTLQWIEYQLDTAATVKEVIENCSKIRISQYTSACEFLVSDREGNSAVIEFLKDKLVVHTGVDLPSPVISNRNYNEALKHLINFNFKSQNSNFAQNYYNLYMQKEYPAIGYARFILATYLIKEYQIGKINLPIMDYAFFILHQIRQSSKYAMTQWSIVYNPIKMTVSYKTKGNYKTRKINFNDFNFNKNQIIDMYKNFTKVKQVAENFSLSKNNEIMAKAFADLKPQMYKGILPKNLKNPIKVYYTWTKGMPEYIKKEYGTKINSK